jgi:hypothetical protein
VAFEPDNIVDLVSRPIQTLCLSPPPLVLKGGRKSNALQALPARDREKSDLESLGDVYWNTIN